MLSGGACRDIVEKHVMCKLNGTDLKFFEVNTETRKLIKRSSRAISTLEVAWEHKSLWSSWLEDERSFCWEVAYTNKLELLKWIREEKKCEWDYRTITAAASQGNRNALQMSVLSMRTRVKVLPETVISRCLKYLHEEAKAPWGSLTASWAALSSSYTRISC